MYRNWKGFERVMKSHKFSIFMHVKLCNGAQVCCNGSKETKKKKPTIFHLTTNNRLNYLVAVVNNCLIFFLKKFLLALESNWFQFFFWFFPFCYSLIWFLCSAIYHWKICLFVFFIFANRLNNNDTSAIRMHIEFENE